MNPKRLVIDLDDTLCFTTAGDYRNAKPHLPVIAQLKQYRKAGFEIVICSARNMRTHAGNIGKITAHTVPIVIAWLQQHDVPYDEIIMGKPWCGTEGFYVDDKAIRPDEFVTLSHCDIMALVKGPTPAAGPTTAP